MSFGGDVLAQPGRWTHGRRQSPGSERPGPGRLPDPAYGHRVRSSAKDQGGGFGGIGVPERIVACILSDFLPSNPATIEQNRRPRATGLTADMRYQVE